jgi:uncharacterized membrane protein
MGTIRGERTIEIAAPLERCYAIAADIEHAPEWQGALREVEVLERDPEGRAFRVETENDAKVRAIRSRLRFSYEPHTRITWHQEDGDVKSVDGWWDLEDLGDGRTRATYGLAVNPGRVLGMLVRGPVQDSVRDHLLDGAAEGLKRRAEA